MPDTATVVARLPRFAVALTLAGLLGPSAAARAQSEADLSWYEGGEPPREASESEATSASSEAAVDVAASPRPRGQGFFGIGASLAYGLPTADFAEDAPYTRMVKGVLRPALDLHYFVTPRVGFGLYTGPGIGFQASQFGDFCDSDGASCRLLVIDAGAFAEYRQPLAPSMIAFVQLNVGYEHYRNKLEASQGGLSASGKMRAHGVGFGVTVGAEYDRDRFGLGPFFSAQLGSYRTLSVDFGGSGFGGDSFSGDLRTALHATLLFGVRGRYEL
jgi:Autotransporter beta-domain